MSVRIVARVLLALLLAPVVLNAGFSVRPAVNIVAADAFAREEPTAVEPGPPAATRNAVFVVSRTCTSTRSLAVFYAVRGTASNGGDYQTLRGAVTIPAGQRSARIIVKPIEDPRTEADPKTIILTLKPANPYTLGPNIKAKAFLADDYHRQSGPFIGPGQGTLTPDDLRP